MMSRRQTAKQMVMQYISWNIPDSKVHGIKMGPTWVLSAPDGPHVGPMNLAIGNAMVVLCFVLFWWYHQADSINTLRPRQNGRHFPDNIFKCIFLNEDEWILIKISLKFVPKGQINNKRALIQIMAWCQTGDKPLSEPHVGLVYWHIYASLSLERLMYLNIFFLKGCFLVLLQ